jgi:hypothetical protein
MMVRGNQGQKIGADDGSRKMWLATLREAWWWMGWGLLAWGTLVWSAGIDLTAKNAETAKNLGKADETFPSRGNGVLP